MSPRRPTAHHFMTITSACVRHRNGRHPVVTVQNIIVLVLLTTFFWPQAETWTMYTYLTTSICLFSVSAANHWWSGRALLRRLDHTCIWLFITVTPLLIVQDPHSILSVLAMLAAAGIYLQYFLPDIRRSNRNLIFFVLGGIVLGLVWYDAQFHGSPFIDSWQFWLFSGGIGCYVTQLLLFHYERPFHTYRELQHLFLKVGVCLHATLGVTLQ